MGKLRIGYKLMTEEFGPRELVENARRAEALGFDFVAISDHFSPWIDDEGHAPFAWSVLGAVATATERVGIATAVTCPILRYHPAVVAQAAATVGLLSGGRFSLGLGTGELLNEHVVARRWPSIGVRLAMLEEAIEIIRLLFDGEEHSYRGDYFEVEQARLFDCPDTPPPILVAAAGPQAAELAGRAGDGLFSTSPSSDVTDAYEKGGGKGPRYSELSLCYAADRRTAAQTLHKLRRWSALGWDVMPELPGPRAFESASETAHPEDLAKKSPCGPDVEEYVRAVREYADAGFDHLVLNPAGSQQEFFDFYEKKLGPRLHEFRADRPAQ